MRFSYAESMVDPAYYVPLAQAAEDAGYHGFVVPDSICYPRVSDTTYPFNPDGSREFLEDKPFIEPFALIPALGVVTSRIRFITFVVKLPIRHPVLVAKQASSVAVLTGGRFVFGVGSSPWPEDYALTDVPWERRGRRMDESIAVIRGLTSGEWFEYHGEIYDVPEVKMTPAPAEPIPILVGGHGEAALRRAATMGDGWLHGGGDQSELPGLLARLRQLRAQSARADEPFEVHVISFDAFTVDGARRLEDEGVTDAIVGFRWPYAVGPDTEPLQSKLDNLRRFADEVIAEVGD
ncbi:MAG TPA: TIGR03619 family F420-dependent LLM class oxidoreductase [Acidimicrobiales bacterium]|nr:TIGR03619 family F420-dependent LLM class oxidoreductase [Acidimicrobiales bacterium]